MQPWTDYAGARRPAGGPVLHALLDDLLPAAASRTLVLGPHDRAVLALAAARSAQVTVLVRSVGDAAALRESLDAGNVTVLAGALDGLADQQAGEPFDVLLAADGLDRVLGPDSPALSWPQRAAALARLAAAQALVVVGVANEFSLTGLLDRRPVDERHGDDEWRPLHDDPSRPTAVAQVAEELRQLGLGVRRLYAVFDEAGSPHTVLDTAAAARTRPGRLAARLATAGLAAAAAHAPLLAPVADGAAAAARAGMLDAVAPGWLAVCGPGRPTRTGYAAVGDPGGVLGVDLDGDTWRTGLLASGGPARTGSAGVAFDPAVVADRVPDTDCVEVLLLRLAAAQDVPGFRRLAARLGDYARDRGTGAVLCFEDVHVYGQSFTGGILGWRSTDPVSAPELLAGAWHRFADRLVRGHHRHPWPPWMADGDDLVTIWLAMSGVQATGALVKRGREIADAVAAATGADGAEPDLRTVLADAHAARVRSAELAGHIFGLERTLRFRDQALRTREQQLRTVRDELRRIKGSRALRAVQVLRKAAVIRHPRRLARAVRRRLRRR